MDLKSSIFCSGSISKGSLPVVQRELFLGLSLFRCVMVVGETFCFDFLILYLEWCLFWLFPLWDENAVSIVPDMSGLAVFLPRTRLYWTSASCFPFEFVIRNLMKMTQSHRQQHKALITHFSEGSEWKVEQEPESRKMYMCISPLHHNLPLPGLPICP